MKVGDKVRVRATAMPWGPGPRVILPEVWTIKEFISGVLDESFQLTRPGREDCVIMVEDLVHVDVIEQLGDLADDRT